MTESREVSGLVHALLLDGQGGADPISLEQADGWQPADGCLWLHFDFDDAQACAWLREESGLGELIVDALISDETRPRSLAQNNELLLSLRGLNLHEGNANPGHEKLADDDPGDMVSLRIWTDGKRLISTRRRRLLSTQDLLAELVAGQGPQDAEQLLVAWASRIVGRMNDTIEDFDDQVLALEDAVLAGVTEGLRLRLARLRRQSIAIRRYLAPQREAMHRLVAENLDWLGEPSRRRLRETNDRLIRYIEDIDETRDRAALAQEELLSRVSEQINERSYLFTVVATIFLPLGFFTGLMGINVGGMPGVDHPLGFWIVAGLSVLLGLGLALIFRMRRWL